METDGLRHMVAAHCYMVVTQWGRVMGNVPMHHLSLTLKNRNEGGNIAKVQKAGMLLM